MRNAHARRLLAAGLGLALAAAVLVAAAGIATTAASQLQSVQHGAVAEGTGPHVH
jgi:hypothetical protein